MRSTETLEPPRVDPAGAVAHQQPDLAGHQRAQLLVAERGELADRLDPGGAQLRLGARPDPREQPDRERREERGLPAGRTIVSPPGLRRSDAILATTFELASPSEHESCVRARITACTDSASARASSKAGAISPRSR